MLHYIKKNTHLSRMTHETVIKMITSISIPKILPTMTLTLLGESSTVISLVSEM